MIEIHKRVARPQPLAELLARDYLSRPGQEHAQNLEGLFGQLQTQTVLAELSGFQIGLKHAEAHIPWWAMRLFHL
jgi:hypothetical protein